MGFRIELTNRSSLDDDTRKSDGPVLCGAVTSWGMLASPTASDKDFYWQNLAGDKSSVIAQATYHFFCQKVSTDNTPNVLAAKLFIDPSVNPLGFPIVAYADMKPNEHFAEWRMDVFAHWTSDSAITLFRVPDDQVWYHHLPPPAPVLTPWRVIYNIFKYGWQP